MSSAVNIVGFSGATFTNAPNAGAIFVVLDDFEKRAEDPKQVRERASSASCYESLSGIQEALIFVVQPPPVQGIGNAGGFRMMVEDRAGRGPQALQRRVNAMMAKAAQTPGLTQVFSLFETSTPQLYLDIDRTKAQLLGVSVPDVFAALQIYIGSSYVNDFNLFGRTFRVTAQADSRLSPRSQGRAQYPRAQFQRRAPCRSPRSRPCSDISGPYRVPRYNLYPAAELDGAAAPGYSLGPGDRASWSRLADETLPDGFAYEWTTLAFQQIARRQHRDVRLRAGGGVRVPGAGGAIRKPDAAARGHPDRADVPRRLDHRRRAARAGQQHPHPGRLRGADRAGRQERDPDRRVRQAARGSGPRPLRRRRSRRRGCGCGRS